MLAARKRTRSERRDYLRAIASQNRVGRIILAARREFIVKGDLIRTRDVLERAYPRLKKFTAWHYLAARRALRKEATIVARMRFGSGRPALWAPKDRLQPMQGRKQCTFA
jgi:hypothetical protein